MKAIVIARPKFQVPPEQALMIVQGGIEWYERYKDRFTEFGTFLGGGGFGVVEVDSTDELNKMIVEMPFSLFMDITTELYMEGDTGFRQFQDAIGAMMEATAP